MLYMMEFKNNLLQVIRALNNAQKRLELVQGHIDPATERVIAELESRVARMNETHEGQLIERTMV